MADITISERSPEVCAAVARHWELVTLVAPRQKDAEYTRNLDAGMTAAVREALAGESNGEGEGVAASIVGALVVTRYLLDVAAAELDIAPDELWARVSLVRELVAGEVER